MKNLLFLMLFSPLLGFAQAADEYLIFELNYFTPAPGKSAAFESALGAHNKKFHASGPYGVRVYTILNGPNTGQYVWSMGPLKWSAYDGKPSGEEMHDQDWSSTVDPNLSQGSNTQFMKLDSKLSRFPNDFSVNRIYFNHWDAKPMSNQKLKDLIEKVHKVYVEKLPNDTYGIYFNELPSTKAGNDISVGFFFDKYSWISEDSGFDKKFEEVHGNGSWETFLKDWHDNVLGMESEIWEFREDLSGMSSLVKAAERQ